jgi:hypothetical protein
MRCVRVYRESPDRLREPATTQASLHSLYRWGLPFVLQSDPATGRAIVAAALLTVAVALGALWFRRGRRVGGQRIEWAATILLALARPVAFSHLGLLSALFVPSFMCALLAAASTFRPAPAQLRNGL